MPAARRLLILLLPACWTAAPPPRPLTNATPTAAPAALRWHMTEQGLGKLDAATVATEPALQRRLRGVRVVTKNLGEESGIVFDVYDGVEKLVYVVPDDIEGWIDGDGEAGRYETTMFAVFAVSPRITVEGRTWRVGQPFTDDAGIDVCECWGGGEVTACFAKGTRMRVIFELPCEDTKQGGARAMRGKPIARIMWKRELEPVEAD